MKRVDSAKAFAARAVELYAKVVPPDTQSCYLGLAYLALGRALLASGRADEARPAFTSAAEQLRPTLGANHRRTREAERLAGNAAERRVN